MSAGGHPNSTAYPHRECGFSLVELVAALAIGAILVAVAVPSFSSFITQQRIKATAGNVYLAMGKARSEAVRRNVNVTVQPTNSPSGWQGGWGIQDPVNGGYLDSYPAVSGVTITATANNVVYQGSGRIQGGQSLQFQVSSSGTSATPRCVLLDASGRPYLKASAC